MEDQGKRILMFVVAAAAIFFAWQWLFPPEKPVPPPPAITAGTPQPSLGSPVGQPIPGAGAAVTPAAPGAPAVAEAAVAPVAERPLVVETPQVRVVFSNVGGVVKEWVVLHDPIKGRVMNEHLFLSERPGLGLGATNFLSSTSILPPGIDWQGEQVSAHKVKYTARTAGLEVVKVFELFPADYVIKLTVDVTVPTTGPASASQQLAVSLFGHAVPETGGRRAKVPTGAICHINGEVSTESAATLQRGPRERRGRVQWVGLAHQYDLVALAPQPPIDNLACNAYPLEGVQDGMQVDLVFQPAKLKAGEAVSYQMALYVGPKYLDRLEGADDVAGFPVGLTDVVDYGWFSFISRPMLWLLHQLYNMVQNWGIAIILLTMLVKLATLYWTTKSMRSMKAMAALKPQIEELQKRYPDDRQAQQQAQMALFKQHGVSPLAGCLPMLLQMPIWLALYKMLSVAGELHQAVFIPGWLEDLTARDPYFITPVLLTIAMFLQSKVQPPVGDSMQQKVLMYGLPLMFGFMGLYFPSGLGVYMLTNTLLGILHSLYMKKTDTHRMAALATVKEPAGKVEVVSKRAAAGAKPAAAVVTNDVDDEDADKTDDESSSSPSGPNGARKGQRSQRRGKRR